MSWIICPVCHSLPCHCTSAPGRWPDPWPPYQPVIPPLPSPRVLPVNVPIPSFGFTVVVVDSMGNVTIKTEQSTSPFTPHQDGGAA